MTNQRAKSAPGSVMFDWGFVLLLVALGLIGLIGVMTWLETGFSAGLGVAVVGIPAAILAYAFMQQAIHYLRRTAEAAEWTAQRESAATRR